MSHVSSSSSDSESTQQFLTRILQDNNRSNGGPGQNEAVEFIAFLIWYLFLVICCVLPTCCAYRRRRLMEARIAQQQANFDLLHQQNIFILSSLQMQQPDMDGEEARTERTKRISEALEETTFVVTEKDIIEMDSDSNQKSSIHVDEELGAVLDHDTMDSSVLKLPPDGRKGGSRTVPGGCAICLCPYEIGDRVSWSKMDSCKHAFHTECIIPWLAKKSEPKCPCCRQEFCDVEPVTAADLSTMTPFGMIPTNLIRSALAQSYSSHLIASNTNSDVSTRSTNRVETDPEQQLFPATRQSAIAASLVSEGRNNRNDSPSQQHPTQEQPEQHPLGPTTRTTTTTTSEVELTATSSYSSTAQMTSARAAEGNTILSTSSEDESVQVLETSDDQNSPSNTLQNSENQSAASADDTQLKMSEPPASDDEEEEKDDDDDDNNNKDDEDEERKMTKNDTDDINDHATEQGVATSPSSSPPQEDSINQQQQQQQQQR